MKKHLHEAMGWPGPMTHRQYLTWREWLKDEWNTPSRSDFLLMRIAQRVQQVLAKNPRKITLEHQKVEFQDKDKKPKDKKTAAEWSKARWIGLVGGSDKIVRRELTKEEIEREYGG